MVGFTAPPSIREYAPAPETAICSRCLQTVPAHDTGTAGDDPADADFSVIHESFPSGNGGAAFALVLGKLDSLALNRDAIEFLCEFAEREGTDVRLALERLGGAENLDPAFDIERRTSQLAAFR